jgi:ferritin-like protein
MMVEYVQICNMTAGKDHRTYDFSLAILNELKFM